MSADSSDFSGDLQLEATRPLLAHGGQPTRELRPGGLRASGWAYTQGLEEEKAWTVEEDPPPQIVTLIALWEFCRALLLAPAFATVVLHHSAQWNAWYLWRIYFVASNGELHISWMSAVVFLYSLVIGTLIWNTVKWSRWILVATSLYSALLLGRFLYLFSDYIPSLGNTANAGLNFLEGTAWILIVLNVIIAIGLAFAPGVADVFNHQKPFAPAAPAAKPSPAAPAARAAVPPSAMARR